MVICKECGKRYVAETSLIIHIHFTCHKYNIVKEKNTERHVFQHFVSNDWDAVHALALECNPHWPTAQGRRAERDWVNEFGRT